MKIISALLKQRYNAFAFIFYTGFTTFL